MYNQDMHCGVVQKKCTLSYDVIQKLEDGNRTFFNRYYTVQESPYTIIQKQYSLLFNLVVNGLQIVR